MTPAPVPPDGENPTRDMNPYRYEGANLLSRAAWDSGYSVGFAAGRAAATPDPPDMTNMCEGESPDHKPGITPAASPDERLREAAQAWLDQHAAMGGGPLSWASQIMLDFLAAADREAPDEET